MFHTVISNSRMFHSIRKRCVAQECNKFSLLNSSRYTEQLSSFLLKSPFSTRTTSLTDDTEGEKRIKLLLEKNFPNAVDIKVRDVSGGCGSMYAVGVCAKEFNGLPMVKQHRLVHEALKNEIKDMHGIQIETTTP